MLTTEARAPELLEKIPTPVCSIIDFKWAVSLIKLMPFQIKMIPKTTLKMVSHEGWLRLDLVVVIVCGI